MWPALRLYASSIFVTLLRAGLRPCCWSPIKFTRTFGEVAGIVAGQSEVGAREAAVLTEHRVQFRTGTPAVCGLCLTANSSSFSLRLNLVQLSKARSLLENYRSSSWSVL